MAEILSYKKYAAGRSKYEKILKRITKSLETIEEELSDACVGLAMNKAWKEWNDNAPEGTSCEITDKSLIETGDKNIYTLMSVLYSVHDALETLPITLDDEHRANPMGIVGYICSDKMKADAESDSSVEAVIKTLSAKVIGVMKR